MEEIPTPPLETYDQRTLFEITKRMMAKSPDDRFQTSDDLVQALETGGGFAAVGLASAATKAIPSLAGARLAGAPTTPLPRVPGKPGADHHKRSVGAGIALWVMVLAIGLGGPGLYAYKKGLLFFVRATPHDSAAVLQQDTVAQRLIGDTGASPRPATTRRPARAISPARRTTRTTSVSTHVRCRSPPRASRCPRTRRCFPARPFSSSTSPRRAPRSRPGCGIPPTWTRSTTKRWTWRRPCAGIRPRRTATRWMRG